ncbi:MAG: hypothetical protein JXA33_00375 [Anaerolineae bacterium]|nr:hypothetical protein [Anaerolineae bacterium]
MTDFETLQAEHLNLLEESENEGELDVVKIHAYIERACLMSVNIGDPHKRNQLRANLNYWASYIYDRTGVLPDTTLRPGIEGESQSLPERTAWLQWLARHKVGVGVGTTIGLLCIFLFFVAPRLGRLFVTITDSLVTGSLATPKVGPTEGVYHEPLMSTQTPIPAITPSSALIPLFGEDVPNTVPPGFEHFEAIYPFHREQLLATVQATANACDTPLLYVYFDSETRSALKTVSASAPIVRIEGLAGVNVDQQRLSDEGLVTFFLDAQVTSAERVFLVRLEEPEFMAMDVIVQFVADCSQNEILISYQFQDAPSRIGRPILSDDLQLDWELLTWGPSPFDESWVAQLRLIAQGGDRQSYVYWVDGVPLATDVIVVNGQACQPARRAVGVSSGGKTVLRELVLLSPYCP